MFESSNVQPHYLFEQIINAIQYKPIPNLTRNALLVCIKVKKSINVLRYGFTQGLTALWQFAYAIFFLAKYTNVHYIFVNGNMLPMSFFLRLFSQHLFKLQIIRQDKMIT